MKRTIWLLTALISLVGATGHATQSVITDVEGSSCIGDDKSRKQAESVAVQDAKRKGADNALTLIKSETRVKDAVLEQDLLSAYSNAQVRVVQELEKGWYREEGVGDCYRVKLKVEVSPDENALAGISKNQQAVLEQDPTAPLSVKVWTDRKKYLQGERIKIYLKGNKPFYGRVVYKDALGHLAQLLPNPQRSDNYFNGGSVYEIPAGADTFDLQVTEPYGVEGITLYASTAPQGDVDLENADSVFYVKTKPADIPISTRGLKIVTKTKGTAATKPAAAEFSESSAQVETSSGSGR